MIYQKCLNYSKKVQRKINNVKKVEHIAKQYLTFEKEY